MVFIAAAAAKINAQLQAKKGIQHVDVPPIRSVSTRSHLDSLCSTSDILGQGDNAAEKSESPANAEGATKLNAEIYVADGDYIKDIEINDLRNRYTLTKGSTQKMVNIPLSLTDTPVMFLTEYWRTLEFASQRSAHFLSDWMKLTLR
jgi:hypothetical protein